jgi:hypothetical protein
MNSASMSASEAIQPTMVPPPVTMPMMVATRPTVRVVVDSPTWRA